MNTFNDLLKEREKISKMLQTVTKGEIIDFDFIIDHLTMGGRPSIITIMLGVPGKVKKQYNGDLDAIIDKHENNVTQVISAFGFPELFARTIKWTII